MLRISELQKYFGEHLLFESASFDIGQGERVGIVGPNGCGKSTLLKIIAGCERADSGFIKNCGELTIAYLPQQTDSTSAMTVEEYLAPEYCAAKAKLQAIEETADERSSAWSDEEYSQAFTAFEDAGGYELESQLHVALESLSLHPIDLTRTLESLSGGERTKVSLIRIILMRADIHLLDEPTNNLDESGIKWLEHTLQADASTYIVASHDREFLDHVCTRTLEIDDVTKTITSYSGNYTWYKLRKKQDEERQLRQYREQQNKIQRLTEDIRAVKNQAMVTEKSTQNDYIRGRAKKVAAKAKAREARLTRMIELEKIEKPRICQQPKFSLNGQVQYSSSLIECRDLGYAIDGTLIVQDVNFAVQGSGRIAIGGSNGSGKSTLLKLIAGELTQTHGHIIRKQNLRIGYLPQELKLDDREEKTVMEYFHSQLAMDNERLSCAPNMMRRSFTSDGDIRTLLHRFQFQKNDVFKQVKVLSRGERTKLLLATFMAANRDLLILDEPTNHLDLQTIECLEEALTSFQGALIIVSHDRYFIRRLEPSCIWHLENRKLRQR